MAPSPERSIANLVHALAEAVDDADGDRIEALFGDATFTMAGGTPREGGAAFREVIERGGRYDEFDLYGRPGGYVRLMDSKTAGHPCLECGTTVEKIQYLGGACYLCPRCQI